MIMIYDFQCHHISFFSLSSSSTPCPGLALIPMLSRSSQLFTFARRASQNAAAGVRLIHIEKRMEQLGIELPTAPTPKANYNIICYDGDKIYLSGHLPIKNDGTMFTGRIGPEDQTVEHGYAAARQIGLNLISTLKNELGDLDRVDQIVKVFGIVQSSVDFKHQHMVMDGCSDLFMEVFSKEKGYHARSAIGTSTLPLDVSVEIEAIVRIKN